MKILSYVFVLYSIRTGQDRILFNTMESHWSLQYVFLVHKAVRWQDKIQDKIQELGIDDN